MLDFKSHQNAQKTFRQLLESDWLRNLHNRKSKLHQQALREHIMRYLQWLQRDSGFNIEPCHRWDRDRKQTLMVGMPRILILPYIRPI
jgi:histone-lysine N-methyltransferase SUV420H